MILKFLILVFRKTKGTPPKGAYFNYYRPNSRAKSAQYPKTKKQNFRSFLINQTEHNQQNSLQPQI